MKTVARVCMGLFLLAFAVGCPSGSSSSRSSTSTTTPAEPAQEEPAGPPAAPANLLCAASLLDVFLSWDNGAAYSSVRVSRNGVLVATLAGSAQAYSEQVGQIGTYSYDVVGVGDDGQRSTAAGCSVTVSSLAPVENLVCAYSAATDRVSLSWSLPAAANYDAVQVRRGGVLIATLPGSATFHIDQSPAPGTYQYQVRGTASGQASSSRACSVVVTALSPIRNFACATDQTTGELVLTWQNGEVYDVIDLYVGGERVTALDGSETTYRYATQDGGEIRHCGVFEFGIEATRGGRTTALVTAAGTVGRIVWDADTEGVVAGYHVYVWVAGEAPPATDSPSHTVGLVTSLSLSDLLAAGVLPVTRTPMTFTVALTAHNAAGDISDMSESVDFTWTVFSYADLH